MGKPNKSLADRARFLMRMNISRDGYSLEQAAETLGVSAAHLDLTLWRTNGGFSPREFRDRSTNNERRVQCELKRAAREWAALQDRSA